MPTHILCSIGRVYAWCFSITRRKNPLSACRLLPGPSPLLTKPGAAGQDVPETEAETAVHADEDVLQDRHLRKETDVLEGPADAELCNPIRGQADGGTPVESDGAPIGLIHPGKHVEECRLPRSIGTNDGDDLPLWHRTA